MTKEDFERFAQAFDRLAVAFQKRFAGQTQGDRVKDRVACQLVYFQALQEYPIEAVEAAAHALAAHGSIDNWFPRAPEWGQLAMEHQVAQFQHHKRKRLLPSPEEIERDLRSVRKARAKLFKEAKRKRWTFIIEYLEAVGVHHPSEDTRLVECDRCLDSGRVQMPGTPEAQPGSIICGCVSTNPELRRRELEQRTRELVAGRRRRAAALNPARERQLTS